jgi:HEAT repeat protein
MLSDDDEEVRQVAADALGKIEGRRPIDGEN